MRFRQGCYCLLWSQALRLVGGTVVIPIYNRDVLPIFLTPYVQWLIAPCPISERKEQQKANRALMLSFGSVNYSAPSCSLFYALRK